MDRHPLMKNKISLKSPTNTLAYHEYDVGKKVLVAPDAASYKDAPYREGLKRAV